VVAVNFASVAKCSVAKCYDRECGYWPIGNASTGRSGSIRNAGTGRIDGKYDGGIMGLMAGDAIASDAMGEATATRLWR
jgi:hypothetical protein